MSHVGIRFKYTINNHQEYKQSWNNNN